MYESYTSFFNFFGNNTKIKYKKSKNTLIIPTCGYNFVLSNNRFKTEPVTVDQKIFELLYEEFTYGLFKYFPKKCSPYFHSGGSLHDILTHNFISLLRLKETDVPRFAHNIIKQYTDEIMDIDVFVCHESDDTYIVRAFIQSLHNKYRIRIKNYCSIINVYIEGIPRIIQFIFTNETSPADIISRFDLTHLMMYYENKSLYMNNMCKKALSSRISIWSKYETNNYRQRIYKNIKRGYKIGINNKLIFSWRFIFLNKYIDYKELEEYYKNNKTF